MTGAGTVSQQEMLALLKTRGFDEGFQTTPLREFKGRLVNIGGEMATIANKPRVRALYYFEELEVIESKEPYTDPITQINILQSDRKQSAMGVFGMSIDRILNAGLPEDTPFKLEDGTPNPAIRGQADMIGKVLHMKLTGGHMMWDGRAPNPANPSKPGAEVARECWEVIAIEGEVVSAPATTTVTATTPATTKPKGNIATALDMAEGKTEQQFYDTFFKNATLKSDGIMVSKIIARTLLPELVAGGQLTKDGNGIFHKV